MFQPLDRKHPHRFSERWPRICSPIKDGLHRGRRQQRHGRADELLGHAAFLGRLGGTSVRVHRGRGVVPVNLARSQVLSLKSLSSWKTLGPNAQSTWLVLAGSRRAILECADQIWSRYYWLDRRTVTDSVLMASSPSVVT